MKRLFCLTVLSMFLLSLAAQVAQPGMAKDKREMVNVLKAKKNSYRDNLQLTVLSKEIADEYYNAGKYSEAASYYAIADSCCGVYKYDDRLHFLICFNLGMCALQTNEPEPEVVFKAHSKAFVYASSMLNEGDNDIKNMLLLCLASMSGCMEENGAYDVAECITDLVISISHDEGSREHKKHLAQRRKSVADTLNVPKVSLDFDVMKSAALLAMSYKNDSLAMEFLRYGFIVMHFLDDGKASVRRLKAALEGEWTKPLKPRFQWDSPYCVAPTEKNTYYIYNVESGKFLGNSNGWDTQAAVLADGFQPFFLDKRTSSVDSNQTGYALQNVRFGRDMFYEGDGNVFVDMANQNHRNPDCNLWTITEDGNKTYRIQIAPTCKTVVMIRNGQMSTAKGYEEDGYLGWVSNSTNPEFGMSIGNTVRASVNPDTWQGGDAGVHWRFFDANHFEEAFKDYRAAIMSYVKKRLEFEVNDLIDKLMETSPNKEKTRSDILRLASDF